MKLTGKCLCGAVCYELLSKPQQTSICHCEDCRRSGGGPFQGWMFLPRDHFHVTAGELKVYAYEERQRSFCGSCGSPITFADLTLPHWIEVSVGTLDQAADLVPTDYNWLEDHLPWVPLDPALPQYLHNSPAPCSP